jgi:hexosaminidase
VRMKSARSCGARRWTIAHPAVVALTCGLLLCTGRNASADASLMPLPRDVQKGTGVLRPVGALGVRVSGCKATAVAGAMTRFERDLTTLVGHPLSRTATIPFTVRCVSHEPQALTLEAREAYRLSVATDGIAIDADSETGVLRALATLRQLVDRDATGPVVPCVRIDDAPRFAWRGLMIDTARHFMSVATLKRQVDAMEVAKLNVLHLHLSDNEAYRLESVRFPRLTTVASHGEYYTLAEMRNLVGYAADRGIRVVPEVDLPGHMLAVLAAYPELGVAPIRPDDPLIQSKGVLNPASEATYRFLEALFTEVTAVFPDRYFHVGGDEVSDAAWQGSAQVEALKQKEQLSSKAAVEAWFHRRVRAMLAARGKTTIGWDEMAEGPLPKDVVVESWRSSNPVSTATATGHRVIVAAGYYLDHLRPADAVYAVDPFDPTAFETMSAEALAMVRRNPATAARVSDGLVAKPTPPLSREQEALVIGGEAPLWAELVSDEMLDGRLWPRALAVAERFWSPAAVKDADDMYRRLVAACDQLRALGLLDDARRDRMVQRLAPDAPAPVRALVDVVAPVRFFARMHRLLKPGSTELIDLADAASTDGAPARRFRVEVSTYLAGDRSRVALLRAALSAWRDNDAAFARVAKGRPLLESAIPVAHDVAALGVYGLAALEALEGGAPMSEVQVAAARTLLATLRDYEDASKDILSMMRRKQPPADLIVLVAPDVARLVDAADRARTR